MKKKAILNIILKKRKTAHLQWISLGQMHPRLYFWIISMERLRTTGHFSRYVESKMFNDSLRLGSQDPLNPCLRFSLLLFYKYILCCGNTPKKKVYFPALERLGCRNNAYLGKCRLCVIIAKASWDMGCGESWVECDWSLKESSKGLSQPRSVVILLLSLLPLSSKVKILVIKIKMLNLIQH